MSYFFPTGEFDSNSSNIITHVVFTDGEDQGECASEEMLSAEVIVEVRNVATYSSSYTLFISCKQKDIAVGRVIFVAWHVKKKKFFGYQQNVVWIVSLIIRVAYLTDSLFYNSRLGCRKALVQLAPESRIKTLPRVRGGCRRVWVNWVASLYRWVWRVRTVCQRDFTVRVMSSCQRVCWPVRTCCYRCGSVLFNIRVVK